MGKGLRGVSVPPFPSPRGRPKLARSLVTRDPGSQGTDREADLWGHVNDVILHIVARHKRRGGSKYRTHDAAFDLTLATVQTRR